MELRQANSFDLVEIDSLLPHPLNPRSGDVGAIQTSIEQNGWFGAVVAQVSTRYILAGNHRVQAAREAGIDKVPVCWVDCDDRRAIKILLADNRTNDVATYNEKELAQLLKDVNSMQGGLSGTLFTDADLSSLVERVESANPSGVEIDGGDDGSGETLADKIPIIVGKYRFAVPASRYEAWAESLRDKVGVEKAACVSELRQRLRL